MTDAPAGGRSNERIFRITIVASMLVHLCGFLLFFWVSGVAARVFPPLHKLEPKKDEEIVTISSAIKIEKKAKPVPAVQFVKPPPPRPRQPKSVPQPVQVAQQYHEPKKEAPPAPSRVLHELAKTVPKAPPNPPRSVHVKRISDEPSAPPRTPPPRPAKRVAQTQDDFPVSAPERPSRPAQLSEQQLAQIDRDLSRTIAQARAMNDPLRVPNQPPAAPKSYRIQMRGALGRLRYGEGYYSPYKSWHANGLDYYIVSYQFTYEDGTYETGIVPWPIHFRPSEDPFTNPEIGLRERTPLPPPDPGFSPPQNMGKALRSYFPGVTFTDNGTGNKSTTAGN